MTEQSNNPRDWVFRINERQQVTFGELAQILGGYGFAITDVVTNERVQKTFVIRDESKASEGVLRSHSWHAVENALAYHKQRADATESAMLKQREEWAQRFEMLEKKIEANGISDDSLKAWNETTKRIDERLDRIDDRLRVAESYIQAAEKCVHVTPDEAKRLEARLLALETRAGLRNDNKPRDLSDKREDGTGIKVVIHDFPTHGDGSFRLQDVGSALKKLRPTRVLVDMAGANRIPAEALRKDWDMPVEPLPKRAKPTPLPPPDCPQHDTRCRPGNCVWERASVSSPAETFARRP